MVRADVVRLVLVLAVLGSLPALGAPGAPPGLGLTCALAGGAREPDALAAAGNEHFRASEFGKALACYRLALEGDPRHEASTANLGLVAAAQGDGEAALQACEPHAKKSTYAPMHYCLGLGLLHTKAPLRAVASLRRARELDANLDMAGALAEASRQAAALSLDANDAGAAAEHAAAAIKEGAPPNDEATQRRWFHTTHMVHAHALRRLGRHAEAADNFKAAAAAQPRDAEALANEGLARLHLGEVDRAVRRLKKALKIKPDFHEARCALGRAHHHGRHDPLAGAAEFRRVLRRDADHADALVGLLAAAAEACDWSTRDADERRVVTWLNHTLRHNSGRPPLTPFDALVTTPLPQQAHRALAMQYARAAADDARAFHGGRLPPRRRPKLVRGRPIRVAYVTSDLGTHPVGRLVSGLFARHGKHVLPTVFSLRPSDGSQWHADAVAGVAAAGGKVVELAGSDHAAVLAALREWEPDVLVDLMGYTAASHALTREMVAASRIALGVGALGYPGTLGDAEGMPYALLDPHTAPPPLVRRGFAEKALYLPGTYQANSLRVHATRHPSSGAARAAAGALPTRASEGLPENAFVFASFLTLRKVSPESLDLWAAVLHRVPGSVLWLLRMPGAAEAQVRAEAASRGLSPGRLVFSDAVSGDAHLARCGLADLFLDTGRYGAHTTATDALWSGVPVLALASEEGMPSRVSGGLLRALCGGGAGGPLCGLTAPSFRAFEDAAARLAGAR